MIAYTADLIGVAVLSWLAIRSGFARLPEGLPWSVACSITTGATAVGKQKGDSSKATIFATAFPAPGKEPQWEQAIGELIRASSTFPGYQGSIVWLAVYATVLPVIAILKPWTTELPALLASALLAAVTVAMMTWIVLPFLTWLFKAWLYPSHQEQP